MKTDNTNTASLAEGDVPALVDRIRYRPWDDHQIKWDEKYKGSDAHRWIAYYNGHEIGHVVCRTGGKHWSGHYAFMHLSRLAEFPQSVEEGKRWIETLFWAWIVRANEDVPARAAGMPAQNPHEKHDE